MTFISFFVHAEYRSAFPFRRQRSEDKKVTGAIDQFIPLFPCVLLKLRKWILISNGVNAFHLICIPFNPSELQPSTAQLVFRSAQSRSVTVKTDNEVIIRGVAENEVWKIEEMVVELARKILELRERPNAECGMVPSSESLILPLGLREKFLERLTEIIKYGSVVVLGPCTSRKGVVVKERSTVNVVEEANGGVGGGCGSGGTRSGISKRLEKKGVCVNGGGGGSQSGGGRADATVLWKINKMEKETNMLMELSKAHEHMIIEQKALLNDVIVKEQMILV
ncbi:uncharacterized protein MONOS_16143 [Monocercomonoides exilis]|uniref:uncharacterized protein n=1 Tax=Monocercomonoides exilis TaxID=2049356 RepID=UPI003559525A|nr:hypothetical protein MONOS_16143 [Monocercomonoides exilis]|eukprot:MONOS_16143.1-p1 / transcript=MONOS_16143.1 / gene=MONOS_16143 / organism=Monocercomonoides_exilis_PA203 / gene_product=unspecified product / transcript_product=unspecified product / location=Mono_scaffold01527:1516-2589(+) / protein_length=280 / sequence_SO=supercontig / SO=protein_coding / is_pseudo=false